MYKTVKSMAFLKSDNKHLTFGKNLLILYPYYLRRCDKVLRQKMFANVSFRIRPYLAFVFYK